MVPPMLSIRSMTEADIPVVELYWRTRSTEELLRMGADLTLMPEAIRHVHETVNPDVIMWEVDGKAVGFTRLDNPHPGQDGEIHLHMLDPDDRRHGLGGRLFLMSVHEYAHRYHLPLLLCQPASANPAPNGMFRKLGIPIARTWVTRPSSFCREVEVNRYELDVARLPKLPHTVGVEADPRPEDLARVRDELRRYDLRQVTDADRADVVAFARGTDGTIVGGCLAERYWGWLRLDVIWVSDEYRGQGIGRELLMHVEGEAKRAGCTGAHLATFDFEAKPFYESMGYTVFGVLDDFPPPHKRYYMKRAL
jgi:GNAT superfamily N-acetyltransferase